MEKSETHKNGRNKNTNAECWRRIEKKLKQQKIEALILCHKSTCLPVNRFSNANDGYDDYENDKCVR